MSRKDILCAVDFSSSSLPALELAFEQAKKLKASVVVMYCYRLVAAMHDEETLDRISRIEHDALSKFKEFEETHLAGHGVPYRFIMEAGYPHFRIEMFIDKNPVELLVIGASLIEHFDEFGRQGFDKFLRNLKVSLAVVPPSGELLMT